MVWRLSMVVFLLALCGCQQQSVECRTDTVVNVTGNAGCWVVKGNTLLLVKQRTGKYSFPGGTAESGERAQCTAHRETWEEAGIDVRVGGLKHQFDNGFYLFNCDADNRNGKTRDWGEVIDVVWADPAAIAQQQWRYPYQRAKALEWIADNNATP